MIRQYKVLFIFILSFASLQAQFQFSIEVSDEFNNSSAFLTTIDDYKKSNSFLTEKIIQETKIDSLGNFVFSGDFLPSENKFYRIYIDKCNEDITDFNHLLHHCEESNAIIFIANNKDSIHFPLNNFEQMFCSLEFTRQQNSAIYQIDSIQEALLVNLQESKSDEQRKIIYNNYFKKLQGFSQTFEEPLAELYAYHLYAGGESFSREIYLNDLKHSNYYTDLLGKLEEKYPNSKYTEQYKEDLAKDKFDPKSDGLSSLSLILIGLLVVSLSINFYFIKKNRQKKSTVDYKTVLSPQEQKVFELMHQMLANKEIADKLYISLSTVKTHINTIYSKLSISSRNEIHQFFN